MVTILTDGEENASREYSGSTIKKIVEELKLKNWTFTYIGTDHNVEEFAQSLPINNVMSFEKSHSGMQQMFSREKSARQAFGERISRKEQTDGNFYDDKAPK